MPARDGTGPQGRGAMTGRGLGIADRGQDSNAGREQGFGRMAAAELDPEIPRGRGLGRARGFGKGSGMGRGQGKGRSRGMGRGSGRGRC